MKTIHVVLVSFVLLFATAHSICAQSADSQRILHPQGLLWKIEKQAFINVHHFVMQMRLNVKAVDYVTHASFFNDGRTLHLPTENGVLHLLEQQGDAVSPPHYTPSTRPALRAVASAVSYPHAGELFFCLKKDSFQVRSSLFYAM